ncbi:membrane protein [Stutzerimonas stutzeri]|uniref:Membrane protein n=1 Tax=Stutzerimonas stutzeri TaxID=316 RepID=W8R3R0_STUST|nr:FecR domain-containing protein [Stutzerimonas stutzeri]AHL77540.1 membrane protein [Stutzerimonas stutzeri]MCQ4330438.1 FecR domain-containing protein [Stutzerimonas stutzeri]
MSLDYQVLQAAAQWFAVLQSDSVSEADREAWRVWLAAPEHARAWQRVEQISGRLEPLAGDPFSPAATALLRSGQPTRRQALKTLSILCGGGALALAAGAMPWRSWAADQRTAVGEVRDWRLEDGSRLWLNTDSAVDVAFEERTRQLSLYRGELLMQAVAEPRPLVLWTAEGRLRANSIARFSVLQREGSTQLSVFDGAVEIMPSGLGRSLTVMSGRQIAFDSEGIEPERAVQPGRQSWTSGVLVADNLRLDAFVAELARYRQGYLGCDPRVASLRVVGAYPLADTDRVLDVLADTLALRINRRLSWWVSLEPAEQVSGV